MNLDIVDTNIDGSRVSLSRLRYDEASEILGVWITPSDDNTKTLQSLKTEALEWGRKDNNSHSRPEDAYTTLHYNISAKLRHPLAAFTLSETECKRIMFPAINDALPRARIVANLNTTYRDGLVGSLGGGFLSLYHFIGNQEQHVS